VPDDDDDTRRGLVYGASAYLLWGVFPLYFPLLKPAGTVEILAHRMAWSLVVMLAILLVTRGFGWVGVVLANRRQRSLLVAAAVLVSVNWGTYIYGVNSGHAVETSLGYFINPLFTILLRVLVLPSASGQSRFSSSQSTTAVRPGSH
jgi:chloramphenicol-sensitive protein RarD